MATTAWMFKDSPDTVEFRDDPNSEDPDDVLKRAVRNFSRSRIHTGVSSMPSSAIGTLQASGSSITASVGSETIYPANADTGIKFICTARSVAQNGPVGTDSLLEVENWIGYTPWVVFNLGDA